ncbi:DUF3558 domain-containing protein [Amycolatopsis sp. NBC_00438]|uniref:DUF3558 domain-containing protein n=1 Tax=Amycolatopsis sp. NBC_00438 TaxID=2903558 RepID=UPI002E2472F5
MRRILLILSVSALALCSCTTTTGGSASPSGPTTDQSPPDSTTGLPGPGVPKVDAPIDIAHFKQAPCDALTADQVAELLGPGVTPKADLNAPAGPSCSVNPPRVTQASVLLIFGNIDELGLTSVYRAKYKFFMPLPPVDGYPIAAYGLADDRVSHGKCQIAIGTSDRQTVDIGVAQSEDNIGKKDPCEAARGIASYVLDNLRGVN